MATLIASADGSIYRSDLTTGETVELARFSQSWTDIAVTPGGRVFANTFTSLYELDLDRPTATRVADLGRDAAGLSADGDGNLFVSYVRAGAGITVLSSVDFSEIDHIDLPNLAVDGDTHHDGQTLYYATTDDTVVTIDLRTEEILDTAYHGISSLFGLEFEGGTLFGLASRSVYDLDPDTGESTLVRTLPISGWVAGGASLAGVEVHGGSGADVLHADIDGSPVFGLGGSDVLLGSDARDQLSGGKGRDYLFGAGGADRLSGGVGRDVLDGGKGSDQLSGGAGFDTFVFAKRDGRDRITDFQNDLDIIEIEAKMLGPGAKTIGRLIREFADEAGGDVVINFAARGRITIEDTTIAEVRDDILIYV